jgi:anti-sigma factor RsiW
MIAPEDDLLLHAYVDGELDAAGAIEIEGRLAAEPELARERDRLLALRAAIRTHAFREPASEALRAHIEAKLFGEEAARPASRGFFVRLGPMAGLAASIAVAGGLAGYLAAPRPTPESETMQALVYAHMRSQISGRPVDVASSDRHTVKPWLAAKLPVSAIVVDLSSEGFPLVGGRVDIVEGVGAPTLVFKRREHLVSLTELPARGGATKPMRETQDGYPVESWSDGSHFYVAVSDLSPAELQAFVEIFREAAAKDQSGAARAPN